MQRASSLSKLKAIQEKNNMAARSKEEEEEQAKLKKEKLDEIKKKYTQMGRRKAGSASRRRIVSAKAETQSVMTDQVSAITTGIPQVVTSEGLAKLNELNAQGKMKKPPLMARPPHSQRPVGNNGSRSKSKQNL